jgi:alanyl-tRNA synthetase
MRERAYYTDSYTMAFEAVVTEQFEMDGRRCLILDHTYFYPASGGQPADRGAIAGIGVSDVLIRPEDGAIVHVVEQFPDSGEITATVDWERRFDYMQQHTGQHILSQAFIQVAGAETVGFHLSDDTVTIDLDKGHIEQTAIDEAEALANQIVWQNRPVVVRWASREQAQELPLRKIPANGEQKLRLIDILEFDLTACGGTHVSRTGEVGMIKVIKREARNQKVRIHFSCGGRALNHYRHINQVIADLTTRLTTGAGELAAAVTKLQENEKEMRRLNKQLQTTLDDYQVARLLQESRQFDGIKLVVHVFQDDTGGRARALAARLTANEHIITLLGTSGVRTQLVFSRADDAPGDMNKLLQVALQQLESGGGGGNEQFAQGGAQGTGLPTVQQAVEFAAQQLVEEIQAAS